MCSVYLYNFIEGYSSVTTKLACYDKNESHEGTCKHSCRSRYDKYRASATRKLQTCRRAHSRESSRIARKELGRILGKSRQLRRLVRKAVFRNFPKSSNIHHYTTVAAFHCASMYGYNICSGGKNLKNTFRTTLKSRNIYVGASKITSSNHIKGQMTHSFFFAEKLKFGRFRCQLETQKIFF